ncbi:MAG: flagellar protein FlgN [Nitrospinaceae bacterium]
MNKLIRDLNILIGRKIDLYEKFILLLRQQWKCITDYSLGPLTEILAEKEDLVEKMQKLEQDRSVLMQKIEKRLGFAGPGLTLKKLIQIHPDPVNEMLAHKRTKLLSQIATINELHDRIKSLMNQSSLSLKKSMAFIHSADESAVSPYHSDGKLKQGALQGRMLSLDA